MSEDWGLRTLSVMFEHLKEMYNHAKYYVLIWFDVAGLVVSVLEYIILLYFIIYIFLRKCLNGTGLCKVMNEHVERERSKSYCVAGGYAGLRVA